MRKTTLPEQIQQQLLTRAETKNASIFNNNDSAETLILSSPSDIGVIRNGGRQGAFLGPKVIINEFKKYQKSSHSNTSIKSKVVTNRKIESHDFEQAQQKQALKILNYIKSPKIKKIIHLGGGHDHIYPLLLAIEKNHPQQKLNIINIDAHLDTRVDTYPHSGTPFRQFDHVVKNEFYLHQIGIQTESNAKENFTELKNGLMTINLIGENSESLENLIKEKVKDDNWINILSIDVDCLSASDFRSCSAVNPYGFSIKQLNSAIDAFGQQVKTIQYYGFYEYNPLFDDVSNSDGKKISWQINQIVKKPGE